MIFGDLGSRKLRPPQMSHLTSKLPPSEGSFYSGKDTLACELLLGGVLSRDGFPGDGRIGFSLDLHVRKRIVRRVDIECIRTI
jgi:hypothetical protein